MAVPVGVWDRRLDLQRVHCKELETKLCLKLRTQSALAAWGSVLAGHPFPTQVQGAQLRQLPSAGRLSHIAGRTLSRQRDSSWVIASLPSQPEPRLLPHPHTGSFLSRVELPADGHSSVTPAEADVVHTGERWFSGNLVGGPELLIPALLLGHLHSLSQVEFGAVGWALGERKPEPVFGGVSDFGGACVCSLQRETVPIAGPVKASGYKCSCSLLPLYFAFPGST